MIEINDAERGIAYHTASNQAKHAAERYPVIYAEWGGSCVVPDKRRPVFSSNKKEVRDYIDGRVRDFLYTLSEDLCAIGISCGVAEPEEKNKK